MAEYILREIRLLTVYGQFINGNVAGSRASIVSLERIDYTALDFHRGSARVYSLTAFRYGTCLRSAGNGRSVESVVKYWIYPSP